MSALSSDLQEPRARAQPGPVIGPARNPPRGPAAPRPKAAVAAGGGVAPLRTILGQGGARRGDFQGGNRGGGMSGAPFAPAGRRLGVGGGMRPATYVDRPGLSPLALQHEHGDAVVAQCGCVFVAESALKRGCFTRRTLRPRCAARTARPSASRACLAAPEGRVIAARDQERSRGRLQEEAGAVVAPRAFAPCCNAPDGSRTTLRPTFLVARKSSISDIEHLDLVPH